MTLANLRNIIVMFAEKRCYLGVAQFGSVLEWGSRGRRFESSHPDFGFLTFRQKAFLLHPVLLFDRSQLVMIRYLL